MLFVQHNLQCHFQFHFPCPVQLVLTANGYLVRVVPNFTVVFPTDNIVNTLNRRAWGWNALGFSIKAFLSTQNSLLLKPRKMNGYNSPAENTLFSSWFVCCLLHCSFLPQDQFPEAKCEGNKCSAVKCLDTKFYLLVCTVFKIFNSHVCLCLAWQVFVLLLPHWKVNITSELCIYIQIGDLCFI